jgi:hypothetical protein
MDRSLSLASGGNEHTAVPVGLDALVPPAADFEMKLVGGPNATMIEVQLEGLGSIDPVEHATLGTIRGGGEAGCTAATSL